MSTKRHRTTKAANMVAVLFALGTATIITQGTPITHWTAHHVHSTPQPQPHTPQEQREPGVRDTITRRPHVRLRQA